MILRHFFSCRLVNNLYFYSFLLASRFSLCIFSFSFLVFDSLVQLEKVRVGHDGRGLGTGWYLEEVVIIIHDECWIFPCNRWLADYEDDGKTERDLYAGQFLMKTKKLMFN